MACLVLCWLFGQRRPRYRPCDPLPHRGARKVARLLRDGALFILEVRKLSETRSGHNSDI